MEYGRFARSGTSSGVASPQTDGPNAAFSALRWPLAAALLASALLIWRVGMDGVAGAYALAHVGWCLGLGSQPAQAEVATLAGHCAACYAGLATAAAAAATALWPKA